jgi:hypothetical protein
MPNSDSTPIKNGVDQLRAQMDMPPLADYKKTLEALYGLPKSPFIGF